ncbi:Mitochondrial DNA helicase [Pseudolycoriella hygida]|uniref:DNA 5'-3' helicase n=1 Tax=Pseudolycoriella hygida TaxID=35572 RepID=A0A9Q0NAN5_9DIPT|nr:Mitochondrial DNA helicase [Pseudolycoriella hygida]
MYLAKSLNALTQCLRSNNNNVMKNVPCLFQKNAQRQYCNEKFKIIDNEPTSVLTIRKVLKASGGESTEGFSFIKTSCPACHFADSKSASSIYINKVAGIVVCPSCQLISGWSTFEKFFPKTTKLTKEREKLKDEFLKCKPKISPITPNNATCISNLKEEDVVEVMETLGLQTIPYKVLKNVSVLCDTTSKELYFPLKDVDEAIVGYKRLYKIGNDVAEQTMPETESFGVVKVKTNKKDYDSAILVLSVVDMLALATQKVTSTIVCLPHGLKQLPQQCLPALELYQKLILWFDHDTVGWDLALNFAKKLDEKRCLFVRPTEMQPTPYKALLDSKDIKTILSKAQPILHKSITTFHSLRQDVLSDLQNTDKAQGVKWRRYPVLNKLLRGHRKGELTVLTGPTGCGKTTFMSEYSLDLAMQGVATLWGSFEIRNTRLASTLLRQMAGHPFESVDDFDHWADAFENLPMFFMTFHGQQSIKVVMDTIEHAQYVHDIHHVIIDNVQFMMGTSDEAKHMDRFWKQDAIIGAFRTFATKKNCHVTLVIHPRKERDSEELTTSSIFGGAKATQEADNVLIIQDKRLTALRGKKYLQIAKNRYSGDLGIMPLDFDKVGLSYATKKKKVDEKVTTSEQTSNDFVPAN